MATDAMLVVSDSVSLRRQVSAWRQSGQRIALVPTMGNLHAGHYHLLQCARQRADRVVTSLFVNPAQFGPGEDYAVYPRTFDEDCAGLQENGADLLFYPEVAAIYPRAFSSMAQIDIPHLTTILCGAFRPGHFSGVMTIVCKLFNLVQPDIALFGEKDYQQLSVIRFMVEDLNIPVSIVGVATQREADGLAMSSRNRYLSAEQRKTAPLLYRCLQDAAAEVTAGERAWAVIENLQIKRLLAAGFQPEYFSLRNAATLMEVQADTADLVILAAAWLGKARLIDNLVITAASG